MTIGDITTKVRDLVNTDATQYPDANLLIDLNIGYQKVANWILQAQDDDDFDDRNNTLYPIFTTPMVANQRDYIITNALNILQIKRVDISYDGANWYRGTALDSGTDTRGLGPVSGATTQDAVVDSRYSKYTPVYDLLYGSMFVYPMAQAVDVANGATILAEFTRAVCPFSLTTTDTPASTGKMYVGASTLVSATASPGFDINLHPVLVYLAAEEYATKTNSPQLQFIIQKVADYKNELMIHYGYKDKDIRYTFLGENIPEDVYNR